MAFLDSVQNRQPGDPQAQRVPGAAMKPTMPNQLVNPPAVNAAPAGRPTNPAQPMPGGTGAALPVNQAARPAQPSGSARPSRPGMPTGQVAQPAPAAPLPEAPMINLDRIPTRSELMDMPPGVQVMTPYGAVGPDGTVTPTPEMQEKYQQAVVARRRAYGPTPFAADPRAPQPPVALGKPGINPFTGQWLVGE